MNENQLYVVMGKGPLNWESRELGYNPAFVIVRL